MKTRKTIIAVMVIFAVLISVVGTANADYSDVTCTVLSTKVNSKGKVYILFKRNSDDAEKWCKVPNGLQNLMLATALTAINLNSSVIAKVDWDINNCLISHLILNP